MSDFEKKQADRADRFTARAEAARVEADRRGNAAMDMSRMMQGEPIKVGHHSEGRHRRDIAKMDTNMSKAAELSKKADHYEAKAAGVGHGGISSDDPEAIAKLKRKLAEREAFQVLAKAVNKEWRKAKRPAGTDDAAWQAIAEAINVPIADLLACRRTMQIQNWYGVPFPPYETNNNNQNMKRIRDRITQLESQAGAVTQTTLDCDDYQVVENVEENRIQIIFPGKPSGEIRTILKRQGFRWAPSQGAWQRQLNNAGKYAATYAIDRINEL